MKFSKSQAADSSDGDISEKCDCDIHYLLQEGNELTGAPLVWFGQIEILEKQYEMLTVPRTIHSTSGSRYGHTHLLTEKKEDTCKITQDDFVCFYLTEFLLQVYC